MAKTEKKLTVVETPVGDIFPYAKNPRNNDSSVDAVMASIKAFGFRQPIVCDKDGVIIVGHTRLKAAIKLGMDKVPVHFADMTDDEAKAYRLADNKTNELAGWNLEMLLDEIDEIDMNIPGFPLDDIQTIEEIEEEIERQKSYFLVIVCDNRDDQEKRFYDLQKAGYEVEPKTV